jgi:hypothetical protein
METTVEYAAGGLNTVMGTSDRQGFEAVNLYALQRIKNRGDVYGWAPLEEGPVPRAVLLISRDAPPESFPEEVSGVELVLKPVEEPKGHT